MLYALCPLPYAISVGPFGGLLSSPYLPISASPHPFIVFLSLRYALLVLRSLAIGTQKESLCFNYFG